MLVHCKVPPSIYLAGAHFLIRKYLAQALNKMFPAKEMSAHTIRPTSSLPPFQKKKTIISTVMHFCLSGLQSLSNSFLTLLLIPNCHFTTQHTKNSIASFTSHNYSDNYKRGFQLRVVKPNPSQSFRPITNDTDNPVNHSKPEANTRRQL